MKFAHATFIAAAFLIAVGIARGGEKSPAATQPAIAPDGLSHGELLREGIDEKLVVDPTHLRFLFQGCTSKERAGKKYSQFPWRLGLLEIEPRP